MTSGDGNTSTNVDGARGANALFQPRHGPHVRRGMKSPYTVHCALRPREQSYIYDTVEQTFEKGDHVVIVLRFGVGPGRLCTLLPTWLEGQPREDEAEYMMYVSWEAVETGRNHLSVCVVLTAQMTRKVEASELRTWFSFPDEVRVGGEAFEDCFLYKVVRDNHAFDSYVFGDHQVWGWVHTTNMRGVLEAKRRAGLLH